MSGTQPKQYLALCGRPLIFHALAVLASNPNINRVFVVLAPDDVIWDTLGVSSWPSWRDKIEVLRCGGASRAQSVGNGLKQIEARLCADDWVLVHDAARACLTTALLERLLSGVADDPVGGLLALALGDTLKRADDTGGRVCATLPRHGLWQAQTPQMFRYGLLCMALRQFAEDADITDEASAVERLGHRPLLIASQSCNFKITWPDDLVMAEAILRHEGCVDA